MFTTHRPQSIGGADKNGEEEVMLRQYLKSSKIKFGY